ncbi:hypothetical protein D3C84_1258030 [compost metagenome]
MIAAARAIDGGPDAETALMSLIQGHRSEIQRQQAEAAEAARLAQEELDSYSGPTL